MMEAAEQYYRKLQEAKDSDGEELQRLKAELDELIAPFGDDQSYYAFLRMEREAALGGKG
jgi:hypothetical protein